MMASFGLIYLTHFYVALKVILFDLCGQLSELLFIEK